MSKTENFETETPTQPILILTEEEIQWAEAARRQAAKTKDLRKQAQEAAKAARELQWIPVVK